MKAPAASTVAIPSVNDIGLVGTLNEEEKVEEVQ